MDIFLSTFEAVFLLLGFGIVGFWIIAKKIVPSVILGVLSPLIIDIALPCLVFTNIIQNFNPSEMPDWWTLPLWWGWFFAIVVALSFGFTKFAKNPFKSEYGMSLTYPNAIFFPLAIIPSIFGTSSPLLIQLFIFTLLYPAILFNSYVIFYRNAEKKKTGFELEKLFNPLLLTTVIALIIKLTGFDVYIPAVVIKITDKISGISLPLIMMMIGGNIYIDYKNKGKIHFREIAKFIFIKHIVYPTIIFILLLLIHPPVSVSFLIFLQVILPPVTAITLLVDKAKGNVPVTNQFLVASFILSIIFVPIWVLIYSHFFEMPL